MRSIKVADLFVRFPRRCRNRFTEHSHTFVAGWKSRVILATRHLKTAASQGAAVIGSWCLH